MPHSVKSETRALLSLAIPSVLAQLSQMSMGFVDTLMVSQFGSLELAGVGSGAAVYFLMLIFGVGVVNGIGPVIAHSFGARDHTGIERAVVDGGWIALLFAALGFAVYWNVAPILRLFGQPPEVIAIAESWVFAIALGFPAVLIFAVIRVFADAIGKPRVAMVIAIVAVFINITFNYILMYGRLGLPALGATGTGYASAIVSWSMLAMILTVVIRSRDFKEYNFRKHFSAPDLKRIGGLLRLGLPIGAGHSMEHGFFALTSLLMGQLSTIALASHQIAINFAAITFMVPLGVSIAIATRVGQAAGRGDRRAAALAGWVGIAVAGLFMVATAAIFILLRHQIIGMYTDDIQVIDYAAGLLMIAGAFQISDGLQVSAQGALRGLKDTARPLLTNLFAYWFVGMPAGWLLGFHLKFGGQGLWWGLTIGLSVAAILHTLRFRKLVNDRNVVAGATVREV